MCFLVFIYLFTFTFSELSWVQENPMTANCFFFWLFVWKASISYDGMKIGFEAFV